MVPSTLCLAPSLALFCRCRACADREETHGRGLAAAVAQDPLRRGVQEAGVAVVDGLVRDARGVGGRHEHQHVKPREEAYTQTRAQKFHKDSEIAHHTKCDPYEQT